MMALAASCSSSSSVLARAPAPFRSQGGATRGAGSARAGRLACRVSAPLRGADGLLQRDFPAPQRQPEQQQQQQQQQAEEPAASRGHEDGRAAAQAESVSLAAQERQSARKRQQVIYKLSAIAATVGVGGLALLATYLRFYWHIRDVGEMPWAELTATLALVGGGVFGMEMWARYAHKSLWHDLPSGWALHKSHHEPRTGPFEANDIFAIINGVPAMALCAYGFLTPNMAGGLCFGAGLGITLFGIMYMFIHDGLVHRRFPVGPIAELPSLRRVAVAHQLHHGGKYGGAPWGMFLGPQELDSIPEAKAELDRLVAASFAQDQQQQQQQQQQQAASSEAQWGERVGEVGQKSS